jgi:antirestriction protein ArdC
MTGFFEPHWVGAPSRLAREFGKRFGDQDYAFEELVAELSAAFLCAELQIPGRLQHPEYISSWAVVLRADNKAIWTAVAECVEELSSRARDRPIGSACSHISRIYRRGASE